MTLHHIGTAIGGMSILLNNYEGSVAATGLIMAECSNFWYLLREILNLYDKKPSLAY